MKQEREAFNRQNNFDLLRILSTFAVILIHVNAYVAGNNNISLVGFNLQSFINVITRFCVPCFVMMSGAFILNNRKNIEYKKFYAKSFYKIGIPLAIFSVATIGLSIISKIISGKNPLMPIISLLKGDFSNYWFMFMLIGLYFLVPIIIGIKQKISNKCYCVGSVIWLVIACISQWTSTYQVSYSFGVVFSFLGYFLIGNVIYENMKHQKTVYSFCSIVLSALIFCLAYLLRVYTGFSEFVADPYTVWFSPLIIVASVLLFIGFANIKIGVNLSKLSSTTFIIYLFHTKVYLTVISVLNRLLPNMSEYIFIYILIVSVCAFIISWALSVIYLKIWSYLERRYLWKQKWNSKF